MGRACKARDCDNTFVQRSGRRKFCSRTCAQRYRRWRKSETGRLVLAEEARVRAERERQSLARVWANYDRARGRAAA